MGWKKKLHSRLLVILDIFLFICIVCCAGYVVSWRGNMTEKLELRQHLQEQDAQKWFEALLKDMRCFPVEGGEEEWCFENGYGEGRSYGGNRSHEGIDIMSNSGKSGELRVLSVSDGTVENIGWLELGGYRIGIRSKRGLYYYYAHLASYAEGLEQGSTVKAGQFLGFMGSTGYGPEGTKDQFAVHLHFGIYYDMGGEEKSLNPFYLLKWMEKKSMGSPCFSVSRESGKIGTAACRGGSYGNSIMARDIRSIPSGCG